MRIAHLSDPHVFSLDGARITDFLGKRLLGGVNYALRRRHKHRESLLEAAIDDVNRQAFDHVIVTGDLTNLGLESEFRRAASLLGRIRGGASQLTILPGNHDAYTRSAVSERLFERAFHDYLPEPARWPWARDLGEVSLIALSTAVPTPWGFSSGLVGEQQCAKLEALLAATRGRFRLLALHHPPVRSRGTRMRQLGDRGRLLACLARNGCELVIHGHDHRDLHVEVPGPNDSKIPIYGAPSTTYTDPRPDRSARYSVYTIEQGRLVGKESRPVPRAQA